MTNTDKTCDTLIFACLLSGFLKTSKTETRQRNVTNSMSSTPSQPSSRQSIYKSSSADSSSGGDLALYDIAAALKWIRDNISVFGGDPTRVTLIGHDTGAALVNLLLISTIAKGKPTFYKIYIWMVLEQ